MAKTEFVYVKGKSKWFRHVKPESFNDKETWKHTIYPDKESLEIIRDLQAEGIKNVIKKDEDGYYVSFSRPTKIKVRGQWKALDAPYVVLGDGRTQYVDSVGNGSDITTKLEVYQHATPGGGKSKAARWLSTRVDNLVPYERDDSEIEEDFLSKGDQRAAKGLAEQPPQLF